MSEQQVMVVLGADIGEFHRAMNQVQDSMKDTANRIDNAMNGAEGSVNQGVGGIKNALKGLASIVATAFAVDKIVDFGKQVIETTADIEAEESQYKQVMGDMKKNTDKYLGKMAKAWNKHPRELKKAYTQYVAILKSKGVAEKDAHELAQDYLERTVDANAFANESMADTTGRFMAGIKGEYDSLDSAMVNLSATMMNDIAIKEYGKKFDELSVKQQETLKAQEALRQHTSAGVFGQGSREADSYANNLAMVKNTWDELMSSYGSPMLEFANSKLKDISKVLQTIKTEGFTNALKKLVPPEFGNAIDNAKNFILNLKDAIANQDWGSLGATIGEGLGTAVKEVTGLAKGLADKITEEFNNIDWGGIAKNIGTGIQAFAIAFAGMISVDLVTAMKDGDWSGAGTVLSDVIIKSIQTVAERAGEFASAIGSAVLTIMGGVNWAELGKQSFQFAVSFILGFVDALLDPIAWFNAIASNWEIILMLIIGIIFMPAKWIGKIGAALAKIPFVGRMIKWLWESFTALLKPVSEYIDKLLLAIKDGFTAGFKTVFNRPSIMKDWMGKMGEILASVKDAIANALAWILLRAEWFTYDMAKKLAQPFKFMWDEGGKFLTKITDKIGAMWTKVSEVAGKIKSAVGGMFRGIKTPHFRVSGSMNPLKWKEQGMPKIHVDWYKTGGIFTGASVIGVGESGSEAVVPLSNKSRMKPFAKATAEMMPKDSLGGKSIENIFNISSVVVREEADINRIAEKLHILQQRALRRGGR